ncbi:class I SAM-dependent methyltransferase [Streptomyces piniterrae]|uniref:Class I SAM-dependent methyltransferase n=1 Tax=Streptomyces piniterrae TaxID=2571125 RepID=A0A4U0NJM2_9ACTN|nr:class I SAM-dependent methyltransferase [Streptomyces piniterrae]TJZ54509.1 class I SAM-dependent methyltransferase [Streptomyces piniterrae]
MPFNHNDHYHRLLLRRLPRDCGAALDVGCGTGRFARRLAGRGIDVRAVDPSEAALTEARAASGETAAGRVPRFEHADVTELELPTGHYDFISCLASIHHMPFGTVSALREALAPGGVLVILGCYREQSPADWAWGLVASLVNAVARLAIGIADVVRRPAPVKAPTRPPTMPLAEVRRQAALLLPGCRIRRLLFWRYLLVFRKDG